MGIINRRVEPDSPQSSRGSSTPGNGLPPMPVTVRAPDPACRQRPPRAATHRSVASMSWERAMLWRVLSPSARAAAISSRWAWDLLGGGVTAPESFFGVI